MKFRKYFRIKYKNNNSLAHDSLYFGSIGLKSLNRCNLTLEQLTAAIKSIKRIIRRKNFLVIRALPFWGLTRKPRDVRMGRGKGSVALKIFPLKAGKIIFELRGIEEAIAIKAFSASSLRLPVLTKIVKKNDKRTDSIKNCW